MTRGAGVKGNGRQVAETPRVARIQSLARASAILDVVLAAPRHRARLAEISAALGLNKTTVFNLAESLVALGFLTRSGDGQGYGLGLRNLELGRAVSRQLDIVEVCRPSLVRLCRDSMETVNLALPHINCAMIVESYEGSYGVRATAYAGTQAPYHATACGKALLALMHPDVRRQIYTAVGLKPLTPNTITDPEAVEANIADVAARGVATEREESEIGASCVAIAIRDAFGQPVCSISVAGLVQRMTAPFVETIVAMLKEERDRIEAAVSLPAT